jgi:Rod binding domain-containing protein
MANFSIAGLSQQGLAAPPKDTPEKVHDAAKQFESLLIGQMMKSMHDAEGGWLGSEDQSGSTAMEYAEESFAQAMANNGGLGIASLVSKGLAPK